MTRPVKISGSLCDWVRVEQPRHRLFGAAERFDLEVRVEVVRDAQIGIELQRTLEGFVGALEVFRGVVGAVLREHTIDAPELGPGRRVLRIFVERRSIQLPGDGQHRRDRG